MLHIVAHSLYKANEFLSSGSVVNRRAAMQAALPANRVVPWTSLLLTMLALLLVARRLVALVGQNPLTKPGGWLLTGLLCASITYWLAATLAVGKLAVTLRAYTTALLLIAIYAVSFAAVDGLMAHPNVPAVQVSWLAMSVVGPNLHRFVCSAVVAVVACATSRLRAWACACCQRFLYLH